MCVLPGHFCRRASSRSCGLFMALMISAASAADFHHVHLNVTDPAAAAKWYHKNLGGEAVKGNGQDAIAFGKTKIEFAMVLEKTPPSVTSAVDHIGFAYPNIEAKMRELAASDVEIVSGIQQEGPIKYAFIRDPWGTLVEVVEDRNVSGFHHIHLATPDPAGACLVPRALRRRIEPLRRLAAGRALWRRVGPSKTSQGGTRWHERALDRSHMLVGFGFQRGSSGIRAERHKSRAVQRRE